MRKPPVLPPQKQRIATPHRPKAGAAPGSWIVESSGGTSGGGGGGGGAAPPVSIDPPAEVIFRNNQKIEIDVAWIAGASAKPNNFSGVAVYVEDPDISTGENKPLDGVSLGLDGSSQMSGEWAPARVTDSYASPAVVFPDSATTYTQSRNVRIYLAAFGPNSEPNLVRATDPGATPNILVEVPIGPGQGESGMEWAFLVSNVSVEVQTDFDRPDPKYYLIFRYTPPDPAIPVPPGIHKFGGCRIVFVYEDQAGKPIFPGTDTGINVPVSQSATGYKSDLYDASKGGGRFFVYFCSEDDAAPLGSHINSLVEGVTPFAEAIIAALPGTPSVTNFTISDQKLVWRLDGSFVAQATFSWNLPTSGLSRYSGVILYLVSVTGQADPSQWTTFPRALTGIQSNVATNFILDIPNIPKDPETWTIAAISADNNGQVAEDPATYGQPGFQSPTVTWDIGPPQPGTPGGGKEYAPWVTIASDATATPTETLSTDGVGMVSFDVGAWQNPDDNQFGGVQVAMVVNHDPTVPTFWQVPNGATSFTTPSMPSFGNIGADVPVEFYLVSDDPQGHKNTLTGTTPHISITYTPSEGKIIPARDGWFDPTQFKWDESAGGFTADTFSAKTIQVGSKILVGGAPSTFGGNDNGQIAVMNAAGKLVGWIGQQQSDQGNGTPTWGAWFGQIWIGGTNPLDAPIFVDNQGIIEVGGIAAAQGSKYPYISIRDEHGFEKGRIGAQINVSSGSPGDGVGTSPPLGLTSGAWFTQLAIGGSNLSNWNILVVPDSNNPLGSQLQMRNVDLFLIDYPAKAGNPANNEYQLKMGASVWMGSGSGSGSQWRFPGIQLYAVDGSQNLFGSYFLSRGLVLRGHQNQNYQVLASLVTFNGDSSGADTPPFWGELAMYSPIYPYNLTVHLASGGTNVQTAYNPYFILRDKDNAMMFQVDQTANVFVGGVLQGVPNPQGAATPVKVLSVNVQNFGPVIDNTGGWVGKPITVAGNQSPWTEPINGAGFALSNAGNINSNGTITAAGGYEGGSFRGAGVNTGTDGIRGGSIDTLLPNNTSSGPINGGLITARDHFNSANGYYVNGVQKCDANGVWIGSVQTYDYVFGRQFGIEGRYMGWPSDGSANVIYIPHADGTGRYTVLTVCGGIIVDVQGQ